MSSNRNQQVDELFEAALDIPPEQRLEWLAGACSDDPALRSEVEQLLRAHDIRDGILDSHPAEPASRAGREEEGRRIGSYRVLRELGRGGMGVVYLAERDDGQFRRLVAIKLLRAGPDAEDLQARFMAERHILASLAHPHIAQLLDAGVTDGQMPYLVMEYVNGLPITVYCDRHRLDVRERLRLFQSVCGAVHHAHRNLVIHRDLKPGNILVAEDGQVKLLDFGIAKLQNPSLTALPLAITRTHIRVMTPEYASPEQVRGEPLSTASDVYAMGVLLYALLAGRPPFDFSSASPDEALEWVRAREPTRPSGRLSASRALSRPDSSVSTDSPHVIAAARSTSPERLQRTLAGDLDAIVLMALRKEPGRRYSSADLLAEDIGRYLEGMPVVARKGSRRYHAGKFLRRHRRAAVATALIAISVLAGAAISVWQGSVAREQRGRAEEALRDSEAVTDFLVSLFEAGDPAGSAGDPVTAQDLLRRGLARIEGLSGQPLVQARMLEAVARVYRSMGRQNEARPLIERVLLLRRQALGEDNIETARTLVLLGELLRIQGRYDEAEERTSEALRIQERLLGPNDAGLAPALTQLSQLAIYGNNFDSAERLARRALKVREDDTSVPDTLVASSLQELGGVLRYESKYEEAEIHLRRALDMMRNRFGADDPRITVPTRLFALLLVDRGRFDEADRLLRDVLEIERRSEGPGQLGYAYVVGDLGNVRAQSGDHVGAIALIREHVDLLRRIFGPDFSGVVFALGTLSQELLATGALEEADTVMQEALRRTESAYGVHHQVYGDLLVGLAAIRLAQGRAGEAEALYRRGIDVRTRANGARTRVVGFDRIKLGSMLAEQRRFSEAEAELLGGLEILEGTGLREDDMRFQDALRRLVALYTAWGRPTEAAALQARLQNS